MEDKIECVGVAWLQLTGQVQSYKLYKENSWFYVYKKISVDEEQDKMWNSRNLARCWEIWVKKWFVGLQLIL